MKTVTLTLNVTQALIDKGCKRKWDSCPIALAMMAHIHKFKKAKTASAGAAYLYYTTGSIVCVASAETPEVGRAFINAFDNGRPVKPFRFTATFEVFK